MATRLKRLRLRHNTKDNVGTVRVTVVLVDPKRRSHTRGNIVRSFHLASTKVSLVARSLEKVFNDEEPSHE